MKYEAWRISFQSSEAAARSAYAELTLRAQQLDVVVKALDHIAIKQANDGQAKYAIAQQALATIKQMGGE